MSDSVFQGSGWAFPPSFESSSRELNLVHSVQNINQSIDLILNTRRGERSVLSDFGSPLNQFLFRKMSTTIKGEIVNAVRSSLLDHEPRITVHSVDVVEDNRSRIEVRIGYTINSTNTRHNHVYPFSIVEGTNLLIQ